MPGPIDVVHAAPERTDPSKPIGGQPVFDMAGVYVGFTRLAPGASSPWHHHGACNFFGYVVAGSILLQFGSQGEAHQRLAQGDFFRIHPQVIHRDVNDSRETVLVATFCVGEGPRSTVVDAPER